MTNVQHAIIAVKTEDDEHAATIRRWLDTPGVDINETIFAWTAPVLHAACDWGIKSSVGAQLLLSDERCDVNVQDEDGEAALHIAAFRAQQLDDHHGLILKMLLSRSDTNANCLASNSRSAIYKCLSHEIQRREFKSSVEVLEIIRLFMSHGAYPNVPTHLLAYAVCF